MDAATYRGHLQREVTAYAAALRRAAASNAWTAPVPSCPGWNIRDLTDHVIGIHYWVLDAIAGKGGTALEPPAATDDELPSAFEVSSGLLLEALDQDPATPCWTFGDNRTLAFWQRRQPHEHQIHRWDLEMALGLSPTLDSALAADGIDEVVRFFWPRQVALGRAEEPSGQLALATSDTDHNWLLGNLTATFEPVAALTGDADDVLLALWKRLPAQDPQLTWSGDVAAGRAILALKVVP